MGGGVYLMGRREAAAATAALDVVAWGRLSMSAVQHDHIHHQQPHTATENTTRSIQILILKSTSSTTFHPVFFLEPMNASTMCMSENTCFGGIKLTPLGFGGGLISRIRFHCLLASISY